MSLIGWTGMGVSRDLSFPLNTAVHNFTEDGCCFIMKSLKLQWEEPASASNRPTATIILEQQINPCGFMPLKLRDCLLPQPNITYWDRQISVFLRGPYWDYSAEFSMIQEMHFSSSYTHNISPPAPGNLEIGPLCWDYSFHLCVVLEQSLKCLSANSFFLVALFSLQETFTESYLSQGDCS